MKCKLFYLKFRFALGLLVMTTGCAGPHTPVGAVWVWLPVQAQVASLLSGEDSSPDLKLRVTPSRQVLHGPSSVRVTISDPSGDLRERNFSVRYNGLDVSESFLRQSRLEKQGNGKVLRLENRWIRLPATEDQVIEFSYRNSKGEKAYVRYDTPLCNAFEFQPVSKTGDFRPSASLVQMISEVAGRGGFNPAFFTGLIAQESRFQPRAVSWAKAIGLTQITPLAEEEVAREHPEWPRYPGANAYEPDVLKALILAGTINESNEWRLNARSSVEGGVTFARALSRRWSSDENIRRIKRVFRDPDIGRTQLVLASYHSGYSRVSQALESHGRDWLKSPQLKEARKYVNRIFSYCHHFIELEEQDHENAT